MTTQCRLCWGVLDSPAARVAALEEASSQIALFASEPIGLSESQIIREHCETVVRVAAQLDGRCGRCEPTPACADLRHMGARF